jgi:ABC-2 type transport system permease protein
MNHTIALLDLRVRRRAIIGYALGLGVYAFAIVALYPSFKNDTSLDQLAQSSSTLMAAFGVSGSLTSPTGWLNANLFNNFVPLILIVLTVGYGAWSVAGQDETGTLSLTATLPVTRGRMMLDKSLALAAQAFPAVLVTYLCVLAGRGFDLQVGGAALVGASVAMLLLAVDFGALALLLGALTGSRGIALSVSAAAAAAAYLVSSLAPAISWLHSFRFASPFYWALGNDPLQNGLPIGSALALGATAVALLGAAAVALRRLDLH